MHLPNSLRKALEHDPWFLPDYAVWLRAKLPGATDAAGLFLVWLTGLAAAFSYFTVLPVAGTTDRDASPCYLSVRTAS